MLNAHVNKPVFVENTVLYIADTSYEIKSLPAVVLPIRNMFVLTVAEVGETVSVSPQLNPTTLLFARLKSSNKTDCAEPFAAISSNKK